MERMVKKEKDVLLQEVGQRIKEARLRENIPQKQLADEFESEQSRISKIEKGAREPGTDFYYWFAKRTGCSLDHIICGTDEIVKPSSAKDDPLEGKEIGQALKILLDLFEDSEDVKKYIAERKMGVAEFNGIQTALALTEPEMRVISTLRKMKIEDAIEAMDKIVNHKK